VRCRDLRGYLRLLDERGLLKRIRAPVDLRYEIGAICARSLDRKGPGLLFENIRGYEGRPLAANLLSRTEQLALAFGVEPDDLKVYRAIQEGKSRPVPPVVVETGPCQEEVHMGEEADVYEFPSPWWHEGDGGQYIATTGGVVTADPRTGAMNLGMYRAMIKDRRTLTVEIKGSHPVGETPAARDGDRGHTHILENEAGGRETRVAIALGMDPLLTYVAGQAVPSNTLEGGEYGVAGAWHGAPVEIVKCRTSDLLVPARAETIIEGVIYPGERMQEGPHGESQGFYNVCDEAFVIHVTCITHRKNPVSYGLICRPREDYPKFMFSAGLQARLGEASRLVREVYVPDAAAAGHGMMAVVAARVRSREDVETVARAVAEAPEEPLICKRPRWLIVVDEDCDVRDWDDVMWRIGTAVMPHRDLKVGPRIQPSRHEPLAPMYGYKTSTVVIDATFAGKGGKVEGREVRFPPINKVSKELQAKIESRWEEYGLD